MVTIERISGDYLGVSQYELKLNGTTTVASFNHNRPDDLPTLLRKAADAVTEARGKMGTSVYKNAKSQ